MANNGKLENKNYLQNIDPNNYVKVSQVYDGFKVNFVLGKHYEPKSQNTVHKPFKQRCRQNINKVRNDNQRSLYRTQNHLKQIIQLNIINKTKQCVFLTLSINNTTTIDELMSKFKYFIKRVRKLYSNEFGNLEYILTKELFENNKGYHLHSIIVAPNTTKRLFLEKKKLDELWFSGSCYIGQVYDLNIANYLCPHTSNQNTQVNAKLNNKATRLKSLPANTKIFSCSSGIKKPIIKTTNAKTLLAAINNTSAKNIYSNKYVKPSTIDLNTGEVLYSCSILTEKYKLKANKTNDLLKSIK